MYAPIQATNQMAHKAASAYGGLSSQFAKMTVASQMEGGRQAKGIHGFAGTAKQMAGQISNGQYKGAMQSGGDYLSGVAGTFANRIKMAKDGIFKSPYHEAITRTQNKQDQINKHNAWSDIYDHEQYNNPIARSAVENRIEQNSKKGKKNNILRDASISNKR